MISAIKKFVDLGTDASLSDDLNRRIRVVNMFSAVGMTVTFLLGFRALFAQETFLTCVLFSATILFAISHKLQAMIGAKRGSFISATVLIACLMSLMLILVVTGGSENTGPLWIFTVPSVTMFFTGFRRGLMALTGFAAVIIVIFFTPDNALLATEYSFEFKTRIVYTFITVSFLSAVYEYSRQRSYNTAVYLSEQFKRQARYDPLTTILNRRGGQQQLEQELSRMQRNKKPFSIALADIDRFKSINDTFGHDAGDEVLKKVASVFSSRLRAQDGLSRWGGEEFLFIFPETNEQDARMVTEQIRENLSANAIPVDNKSHRVTSSFGVCEITPSMTLTTALNLADQALYQAKNDGRNKVCTATEHKRKSSR
ncbi:GGDEF domain-containing protein [Alteromonas sp. KS69]|uniref:GGDEF domain-containing protein n=1 Tax=unclassified Alteromonas TaxID=2614992 RepID=UPI000C0E53D4|nr:MULTISPECIES: GGDEF domain-containing protein [unclassified Alteromonas]MBO7923430.1 GGDEF domain-containing protein [Alteromonas sp. K632G]PHS53974.1 MAG: GGDEF domain-containing protein [Alteromonas sp.]RUP75458.1 GGDEF domain-containing protein [Alteromonas sp. KS69]